MWRHGSCRNPPILAAAPLIASLALFQDAGIEALRAKSQRLTGFWRSCSHRSRRGSCVVTPAELPRRGCQLSLRIAGGARGRAVFEALMSRGMVVDWREPDIIRVAPVPLYNSFEDAWRFATTLTEVLSA